MYLFPVQFLVLPCPPPDGFRKWIDCVRMKVEFPPRRRDKVMQNVRSYVEDWKNQLSFLPISGFCKPESVIKVIARGSERSTTSCI